MRRFISLLVLLVLTHHHTFSQGEYLLRGQNGYSGTCGFHTDCEKQAVRFSAGYSYQGVLDINLMYSKANRGAIQGAVLSPSLTFYCLKQEDAVGIPTVGFTMGYSSYRLKTTTTVIVPDTMTVCWHSCEQTTESTVHAIRLSLTGQRRIGRWNVFFFQPIFGAGLSLSHSGGLFSLSGGVSIGTRIVHGPMVIVTPCIERQSGLTSMMVTLSTIF